MSKPDGPGRPLTPAVGATVCRGTPDVVMNYAARAGVPPRNLNLITGASGTTDIEGSYVRGAHGPLFLHVILVNERTSSEG